MLRKSLAVLAFASVGLTSGAAFAQTSTEDAGLGSAGNLIISGERIFGLAFTSQKNESNGNTQTESQTNIGLLWNPGGA